MGSLRIYLKQSATYKICKACIRNLVDFLDTLGNIIINGFAALKYILKWDVQWKELRWK